MGDLISKRTRNAFREALVGWTISEIQTEFDNEGFSPNLAHDPGVSGMRRGLVEQIYQTIDFGDHRDVFRLLEVYQTVVATTRRHQPDLADALIDHLRRDGVDTEGPSFRLRANTPTALQPLNAVAQSLTAAQIHAQIDRINRSIDSDPALAIGTAKELLETICKTILAEVGDEPGNFDLGDLVKRTTQRLKLLPDDIPNAAKGAEAMKKTLRSLGAVTSGLGEIRNLYGSGHGQEGRAKGLAPRHARLAVGAASTLAMFLFETHEARQLEPETVRPSPETDAGES